MIRNKKSIAKKLFVIILITTFTFIGQALAEECEANLILNSNKFHPISDTDIETVKGPIVYIQVYSSIPKNNLLHLTTVPSIGNISLKEKLIISQIYYFDTNEKLKVIKVNT